MRAYFEGRFERWLDRRIPSEYEVELNQKRIFIFPSWQGIYFLLLLLLILIGAINYQNNLAYALTFFLFSIFNTSVIVTYLNVSGLCLRAGRTTQVFAGESAEFEIELKATRGRRHQRLSLAWPKNLAQVHDLISKDRLQIRLHAKTSKRGYFRPGRILLESYYPLGLIRCWSWIDLDFETIVYPKPIHLKHLPSTFVDGEAGKEYPMAGQDDFYGFKDYEAGDSLKQVDWRSYAKGQTLQSKVYSTKMDEKSWVDWYELSTASTEEKLSLMCDWVLQLHQSGKPYGLRLPNIEIQPDMGEVHKKQVLTELAIYGISGTQKS